MLELFILLWTAMKMQRIWWNVSQKFMKTTTEANLIQIRAETMKAERVGKNPNRSNSGTEKQKKRWIESYSDIQRQTEP